MIPQEVLDRAFPIGDPVHHSGRVYHVLRRYYRKSRGVVLYDLVEVVRPPARPTHAYKVPESRVHKPSLRTLGLFDPGHPAR